MEHDPRRRRRRRGRPRRSGATAERPQLRQVVRAPIFGSLEGPEPAKSDWTAIGAVRTRRVRTRFAADSRGNDRATGRNDRADGRPDAVVDVGHDGEPAEDDRQAGHVEELRLGLVLEPHAVDPGFNRRLDARAREQGVSHDRILQSPGVGFGKRQCKKWEDGCVAVGAEGLEPPKLCRASALRAEPIATRVIRRRSLLGAVPAFVVFLPARPHKPVEPRGIDPHRFFLCARKTLCPNEPRSRARLAAGCVVARARRASNLRARRCDPFSIAMISLRLSILSRRGLIGPSRTSRTFLAVRPPSVLHDRARPARAPARLAGSRRRSGRGGNPCGSLGLLCRCEGAERRWSVAARWRGRDSNLPRRA